MFDIFTISALIKKTLTRKDILIVIALLLLYLLTRMYHLGGFPIFSDEGIYIHWSKVAWHDANWRFISLTDGRQPLQTWATIPFLKLFQFDNLFAGRMFGVVSGLFGVIGLWLLTLRLFGKRAAHIAAFLYIITPFYLFFDRLAMIDSFVNASAIWIFLFSVLLIDTLRLDIALLMGLFSGLFLLAKSNVSMFIALSIMAPLMTLKKKLDIKKCVNYLLLYSLAGVLAFVIYNIQRLSPFFHFVNGKNTTFVLTIHEFLQNPFQVFWYNLPRIPLYTAHNLGWATFIFGALGLISLYKKNKLLALYISFWLGATYIFMSFFMRVLFSRYHIFMLFFFILLAAYFFDMIWNHFKKNIFLLVGLGILYLFTFYFNYTVIANYNNIPFLETDRGQYIEGWPSGWGAREIMNFARQKSLEKPVIILAEGNFGMAGDVLDTFLKNGDRISIRGYWPLGDKELRENQKDLKNNYVYAVFAHRGDYPSDWPLKLIEKYNKPADKSALYLFELTQ